MTIKAPTVAVVDHGMGNLRSVAKALESVGADVIVGRDIASMTRAHAICVPGQGIFGRCVDSLAAGGLDELLRTWIREGKPYLGICLGLQVLFDSSTEHGPVRGLGILPGEVVRLDAPVIPHIGWNTVGDTYYYFDHSYVVSPADRSIATGWTEHGSRFVSMIATGSILGVQFHPEKSGEAGLELLERWVTDIMLRAGESTGLGAAGGSVT